MASNFARTFDCESTNSLLDELRQLAQDASRMDMGRSPRVLFRGHRDATWDLLSLFHRQLREPTIRQFKEVFRQLTIIGTVPATWRAPSDWEPDQRAAWAQAASKRMNQMVRDFMRHALAARQLHGLAAVEASRALNLAGMERATIDPKTEPTIFGLAQHHGLPTPLLDWTSDFHVALWFIVDDVRREVRRRDRRKEAQLKNEDLAEVWGMPISCFSQGTPRLQIAVDQAYPTAQSGLFVYDHSFESTFVGTGKCLSIDAIVHQRSEVDSAPEQFRPFRVRFPLRLVGELRSILRGMGHSTATLKPSMDNIAKCVRFTGMT